PELQREMLLQQLLGVIPFDQQPFRQRQQDFTLGGEAHATGAANQQGAAQGFLQSLDGQAQGGLGEMQALASPGKTEGLRYRQEGAKLFDGHGTSPGYSLR